MNESKVNEHAKLKMAYGQRSVARANRDEGRAVLEHHKEITAKKKDTFERALAAENESTIDIAEAPALAQRRRDAEAVVAAAERAQALAQARYNELVRAADGAEAAVAAAVDGIFRAERMELAAQISEHMAKVRALVAKLREYVPSEWHTPVNVRIEMEPEVRTALNAVPPRDPLHVPVNELQSALTPPADLLAARRAAMIRGDEPVEAAA